MGPPTAHSETDSDDQKLSTKFSRKAAKRTVIDLESDYEDAKPAASPSRIANTKKQDAIERREFRNYLLMKHKLAETIKEFEEKNPGYKEKFSNQK